MRGLLGKGGMGVVYKVREPVLGRLYALKLLSPHEFLESLLGTDRLRELFLREAVLMAGLRHPHVLDVLDYSEADGRPYILMDYYCHNLGEMIGETYEPDRPSRKLPVDRAVDHARQVLSGLARLHAAGIIHRDVKPCNVLVTDENQARLTDFGLSAMHGETFVGPENLKVGSPYYAAPEQEQDPNRAKGTADLYSAGVMLYRMLTGVLPESGAPSASEANPDLSAEWDDFLETAMAPAPGNRFQSAADMDAELARLYARWRDRRDSMCLLSRGDTAALLPPASLPLRSDPVRIHPKNAREFFGMDDLWRPETYVENAFEPRPDGTVYDAATGLLWQAAGTPYTVNLEEARKAVATLCREQFAGRDDWRLPTVDELVTIMTPPPQGGDWCIEPVFSRGQRWLWSADRASFVTSWFANVELGYLSRQDHTAFLHVRAVASA